MISGLYCAWGNYPIKKAKGIHMAGNRFIIDNKWVYGKTWQLQFTNNFQQNKLTNLLISWGVINYPDLKMHVMKNLKIYVNNKLIEFNKIIINDENYKQLTNEQSLLYNCLFIN